ncbi:hypothetical protein HY947_06885 [Candidatus Gottesmanbacteria bacterium]|nr:hypothetical protein [Candidatus Gottesmanbacteria bacterium]
MEKGGRWREETVGGIAIKVSYEYDDEAGYRWKIEAVSKRWPVEDEWWQEGSNEAISDKEEEISAWLRQEFGFGEEECEEVLQIIRDIDP